MNAILSIRIQKLFMLAVIMKVTSAFCGWYLQLQWSLGLILPLAVMAAYITLGIKRQDREVTDEKFADSCYYLGFIFTITSIVFSLFDLPQIGERIQDIAVRFGAAMVSTVLGLAVRVYLVSFRPDAADALIGSEDAVLDASQKFREQLVMAHEKLNDFQKQVITATETSVEAVRLQAEKLTQDHSARMERVFVELNERNQQAITQALSAISSAGTRMAQSVDVYTESMKSSVKSLDEKVETFGKTVTRRLNATTFPDDFFATRLAAPLEQLKAATTAVSQQVQSAADGTGEAASALSAAITKLKVKAARAEESLDTVTRLTTAQHALFDTSTAQLDQLKKLAELLDRVQQALQAATQATVNNATNNATVQEGVTAVVTAIESSQRAVVEVIGQVFSRLDAEERTKPQLVVMAETLQEQQGSLSTVLSSLDSKAAGVSTDLAAVFTQLVDVTERLDTIARALNPSTAVPSNNPSAASISSTGTLLQAGESPTTETNFSNSTPSAPSGGTQG